ncbi:MAG: PH domain-containing protein [Anaerolineales bacterium]
MNQSFLPPRQPGLTLHVLLILSLAVLGGAAAWLAAQSHLGVSQTLYILLAAAAFFPLPFLAYRLSALMRAVYTLDRDKFTIAWGLRLEQIPVSDVEWVRPAADLGFPLPRPWLRLPGSVLGTRRHPDLGLIEFLASDAGNLLLVATARRIFAISPADAAGFTHAFQRAVEMGSLVAAPSQSIYPSFVVVQAWESLLARYLWLAGLFLNIGLLLWVNLMIPSLEAVPLGFLPSGQPAATAPPTRLMLLPVTSLFFFLLSWGLGLILYRQPERRAAAQALWAGGLVSSLVFLLAVMFLVTTPV